MLAVLLGLSPAQLEPTDFSLSQFALPGEVPVALVLAWHRHDRAGAVSHQDVVADEHR